MLYKAAQTLQLCKNSNNYMYITSLIFLQISVKFHDIINILCQLINNFLNDSDFFAVITLNIYQQIYIIKIKIVIYITVQYKLHKKLIFMINITFLCLQKNYM